MSCLILSSNIYRSVFVAKSGTVYCCVEDKFVNIFLNWVQI